jgi:segregation and condensation protein B
MELSTIIPHIEALIFASDKPLTSLDIVELINNAFGFMEERINLDQVESAMDGIREKYNAEFYPFEVRESGGGWQFLTKKEFHSTVGQLNGDKFLKRLSNAALETLAIIAYKQPITKGEVESIRGVNSDYSVQKLLEKELIVISGRSEELPGKPLVYTTSRSFMDYFGLNTVDDLPKIREVLADQAIQGTIINEGMKRSEATEGDAEANLTVTDSGELMEYTLNRNAESISLETPGDAGEIAIEEFTGEEEQAGKDEETTGNENERNETGDEEDASAILPMASDLEEFSDVDEEENGNDEDAEDDEDESIEDEKDSPIEQEEISDKHTKDDNDLKDSISSDDELPGGDDDANAKKE